jgi:hypothetical protein
VGWIGLGLVRLGIGRRETKIIITREIVIATTTTREITITTHEIVIATT